MTLLNKHITIDGPPQHDSFRFSMVELLSLIACFKSGIFQITLALPLTKCIIVNLYKAPLSHSNELK